MKQLPSYSMLRVMMPVTTIVAFGISATPSVLAANGGKVIHWRDASPCKESKNVQARRHDSEGSGFESRKSAQPTSERLPAVRVLAAFDGWKKSVPDDSEEVTNPKRKP